MVKPMGNFSGYAGALALAIIMLPIVARTTEDMLLLVPGSLREAAMVEITPLTSGPVSLVKVQSAATAMQPAPRLISGGHFIVAIGSNLGRV